MCCSGEGGAGRACECGGAPTCALGAARLGGAINLQAERGALARSTCAAAQPEEMRALRAGETRARSGGWPRDMRRAERDLVVLNVYCN